MNSPAPSVFSPSPRQEAIFAAATGPKHLLIQACAGSGKTTTLVELCKRVPTSVSTLALSFNKAIADELSRRMPAHVQSRTLHSVGMAAVKRAMPKVQVDEKKLNRVLDCCPAVQDSADKDTIYSDLLAIVPLAMDCMIDPSDPEALMAAADVAGRTLELPTQSLPIVPEVIAEMDRITAVINFSEMLRHPVVHGYPCGQFKLVLCDESQDLNEVQHRLLAKLVAPGGKLLAVGDRFQSIYGFRGADVKSMDRLKESWGMDELPLDVSYRCPRAVVALAQGIVGDSIQPHEAAPQGEVLHYTPSDLDRVIKSTRPGDFILCRTNAPLVPLCFRLLRMNLPARIRGRDIGAGLNAILKKLKGKSVPDLLKKLAAWEEKQATRALAANKPAQAEKINDQADVLRCIAQEAKSVPEVGAKIDSLFSDEVAGVILSTVHKAKGLEAHRVVIVYPEGKPFLAKAPDDQSRNLQYVAVTRAKCALILQPLPKRAESKDV